VKISCSVLCYSWKYRIEYLIYKKMKIKKKNLIIVVLSLFLFTKMHGRTVNISCSVLCYGCKYIIEYLI